MSGLDPTRFLWRPNDGLPWFINLCVTSRCNLHCLGCRAGLHPAQEPSPADLRTFLDRLAAWLPRPRRVILTGGEPLLYPHLEEIVAHAAGLGFLPTINTNGSRLTAMTVDRLAGAGLAILNVSLDGIGETHDRLRNGPGLYQGVMDMLQYLTHHSALTVGVVSTINRINAAELPALTRHLVKNFRLHSHRFQAVVPTLWQPWSNDFFTTDPLWPREPRDLETVLTTLEQLTELRRQGFPIDNDPSQFALWREYFTDPLKFLADRPCPLGDDNLIVLADGGVTACDLCGRIGELRDDPRTLWFSPGAKRFREQMRDCKKPCNYRINCSYTPSLSNESTPAK
ncbi:MAG: radical SAM protein [Myxococcales bacterium]|nr:radical SAM protein [Myxococcales bacterium]